MTLSRAFKNAKHDLEISRRIFNKYLEAGNFTDAVAFALSNGTGYYSSAMIENHYLEIANSKTLGNLSANFEPDSFLHVMTRAHETGGHTRVVERWIESAPQNQKHSVFFTSDKYFCLPRRLEKAVKDKNGEIKFLEDKLSDIEKGLSLREFASGYKIVILHIHMFDYIPIIAFGNEEFKRPVVFYNHADHLFWLGVSIADLVADIRTFGSKITIEKRKAVKSYVLGIPIEERKKETSSGNGGKSLLAIGSAYKFRPLKSMDFLKIIRPILRKHKDATFTAIGPSLIDLPNWKEFVEEFGERVLLFSVVPHNELFDYIKKADILVDSLPVGGGTTMLDALFCGKPVVTVHKPIGEDDYIINSPAYCKTIKEAVRKINRLIKNEKLRDEYNRQVLGEYNKTDWKLKLQEMLTMLPLEHKVHRFVDYEDNDFMDLDVYHDSFAEKEREVFRISGIMKIRDMITDGQKYRLFRILGIKFKINKKSY